MGFTVLHGFAAKGDADAVAQCLQEAHSSVDERDSMRCTALHHACEKGHKKVVKILCESHHGYVCVYHTYTHTHIHTYTAKTYRHASSHR